ncbi:MAG TPA: autotransporter strand-loop-strand O-heptosyltransferase [Stellaceae bacterium]|jgi:autotransporter strand-loop-strand O-heptosyltransferase|nr:autotransporter strand-loop-strand O-heptosyltransferase [Stellaceae bacterium]
MNTAEPASPPVPTQDGPFGIRFDFNDGARISVPVGAAWQVRLSDIDTASVLIDSRNDGGFITSDKHYFVRFRVEICKDGTAAPVLVHDYDARGRNVLIHLPTTTLGDTIAWLPAVAAFQERHGCRLTCAIAGRLIPLFRDAYPHIVFATPDAVQPERFYATYKMMMFYGDEQHRWNPSEGRSIGLHQAAAALLGMPVIGEPPRLALPSAARPIAEPYVCIAAQATAQAKYWNHPHGWDHVVAFLQRAGYRVLCIDQKPLHGDGMVWNRMPDGAEDFTGDRPLIERAHFLHHADFFIGLSSGLSWLAWAARCPIVLISGFTHPINEFATPYRVINYHTCNSCWNDIREPFDNQDFLWCPRHKGTPRQFECSRLITPEHVIRTIRQIPGFAARHAAD